MFIPSSVAERCAAISLLEFPWAIFTSFVLELVVYPAIYEIWKWHFELKRAHAEPQAAPLAALPSFEAAP